MPLARWIRGPENADSFNVPKARPYIVADVVGGMRQKVVGDMRQKVVRDMCQKAVGDMRYNVIGDFAL